METETKNIVTDNSLPSSPHHSAATEDQNLEAQAVPSRSIDLPQHNHPRPSKKSLSDQELTNDVLLSAKNHFKKPIKQDDRFDIFGKNVAIKLRDLEKNQRILSEKIINEALFEAEIGQLTTSHKVMNPFIAASNPTPMRQQLCRGSGPDE